MKTKTETKIHKCSICGEHYIGFGNNAQPYPGRCCDVCNDVHVIPARIARIYAQPKKEPSHD